MKKWRSYASAAAFVLAFGVVVLAYTTGLQIWRDQSGYVFSEASITTSYTEVPYVKTRVDGVTDWVEGSSSQASCWPSRCAYARANSSTVAAGGRFTARGVYYTDNIWREEITDTYQFESEDDEGTACLEAGGIYFEGICTLDSPIIIPTTASQAYRMTKLEDGVVFDIRGDGRPVQVAWTAAGTELAFLALDRNMNGVIDSGSELFGNHTLPGVSNGFLALDQIAANNGDGAIDAEDALFSQLVLWTDRNHNGISEADELRPASEVLEAIGLGYFYAERRDGAGNRFAYRGWARKVGAGKQFDREFKIYDLILSSAR